VSIFKKKKKKEEEFPEIEDIDLNFESEFREELSKPSVTPIKPLERKPKIERAVELHTEKDISMDIAVLSNKIDMMRLDIQRLVQRIDYLTQRIDYLVSLIQQRLYG